MAKRLTQEALGAKLGISQSLVARLAKRGMPTDSVAAARRWRAANLDPTRGGKPPAPAGGDLHGWRVRKTAAEARLLEQRAAVGPAGLVEVAQVDAALRRLFVASRGVLDSLHPRLLENATDAVCAPGDPRYAELYRAMHSVLRNLWADHWVTVVDAFCSEAPALRTVFLRITAAHDGPQSRAAAMLRDRPAGDA